MFANNPKTEKGPVHMKNMSLFSQLLQFFPRSKFESLVHQNRSDFGSKGFSSWQQFISMLFCQLGGANSLSEITQGLASCEGKLKHLGISAPGKSTLAYANQHRPWELYRDLFFQTLQQATSEASLHKRKFRFKAKLYSIDSTTVDLCLSAFEWAAFRRAKGAVKLHLRLDHDGYLPNFAVISDGKKHDSKAAWEMPFEPGSITVFDKGYNDFALFSNISSKKAFFVTRLKENALYTILDEREVSEKNNVISDSIIGLEGFYSKQKYPDNLRIVRFLDPKTQRVFTFLTNNMKLAASTIAEIYKERWQIELLFKALKQHLKIKTFVGTSANAVKIQIWTALIAILILKFLQLKSSFGWSLSNLAALLRMNLFTHRNLLKWMDKPFETPPDPLREAEQMNLRLI